jgi:hypothetical protein
MSLDAISTIARLMKQGKPHRWIPTEYLQGFVTGKADLGKVDTNVILCDDGTHANNMPWSGVDPPTKRESTQPKLCAAPSAKRISVAAWEMIVNLKGLEGPEVAEDDCCRTCALDFVSERTRELTRIEEDFKGLELLDGKGCASDDGIGNVYMSRQWIKQWKARSKTKSFASLKRDPWELLVARRKKPQDTETLEKAEELHKTELWNLNLDLQCDHGQLVPDTSLWQEVTPVIWDFFVKQRQQTNQKAAESKHPPKFPTTQLGCAECNADHQARVRTVKDSKTKADEQRKDEHLSLLFGSHACIPSTMYQHCIGEKENPLYLVSTVWLDNWRHFIAPGKPKVGAPRVHPGRIDNSSLLCPHQKLKCVPTIWSPFLAPCSSSQAITLAWWHSCGLSVAIARAPPPPSLYDQIRPNDGIHAVQFLS